MTRNEKNKVFRFIDLWTEYMRGNADYNPLSQEEFDEMDALADEIGYADHLGLMLSIKWAEEEREEA